MIMKRVIIAIISLLALLSVMIYVGIPIPLSPFAERLERLTGSLLGRNVAIGGPVRLIVSLHPSLQIGDLTIDNPPVNALSQAVRAGLVDCIDEAEKDAGDQQRLEILAEGGTLLSHGP